MKFAKPEDADLLAAAQKSPSDQVEEDDGTVTFAWAPEEEEDLPLSAAVEANADQLATIEETLGEVQDAIEEQREASTETNQAIEEIGSTLDQLEARADTGHSERESQREQIVTLREQVEALAPIQDDVEALEGRLNQGENATASIRSAYNRHEQDSARLMAAVFDGPQPCPQCEDGRIGHKDAFIQSLKLACDQCNFEEEIAIP